MAPELFLPLLFCRRGHLLRTPPPQPHSGIRWNTPQPHLSDCGSCGFCPSQDPTPPQCLPHSSHFLLAAAIRPCSQVTVLPQGASCSPTLTLPHLLPEEPLGLGAHYKKLSLLLLLKASKLFPGPTLSPLTAPSVDSPLPCNISHPKNKGRWNRGVCTA